MEDKVFIALAELADYFVQAAHLGKEGYKVTGASMIEDNGEMKLSIVVEEEDNFNADNLAIAINTNPELRKKKGIDSNANPGV